MKTKRILAALLTAAALAVPCTLGVNAEESTTGQPTLNPSVTSGTLTIHKYEQTSTDTEGTLLDGVEFTVYQLATIEQTEKEETGVPVVHLDYKVVDALADVLTDEIFSSGTTDEKGYIDSAKLYEAVKKQLDTKNIDLNALESVTKWEETTGGENGTGTVKFDLPLGVYMVSETDAPPQILTRSANFIVSIPMTEEVVGEAGTYVWNYHVVAEPKNVPIYGGVKLTANGRTAGTDEGTEMHSLEGAVFRLECQTASGETPTWEAVDLTEIAPESGTVLQTGEDTNKGQLKTDENGVINITKGLVPATYRFMQISSVNGYIADTAAAYTFVIAKDEENNALKLTDTAGNEIDSVSVVNERPDFEANVICRGTNTVSTTHDADYGVNEAVPFVLTVAVPECVDDLSVFKVKTTVEADQFDTADEVSISGNGTAFEKNKDYELTEADDALIIDFKNNEKTNNLKNCAGKAIIIEYSAKLLPGAQTADMGGNVNTAVLSYSQTAHGTDDAVYEIEDQCAVYTFITSIYKKAEGGKQDGNALNGVTFDLYKETSGEQKNADTSYTFCGETVTQISAEQAKALGLTESNDTGMSWLRVGTLTTGQDDNDGCAYISGLPAGNYKLVETKTAEGYNLLTAPVDAKLNIEYTSAWTNVDSYADGKLTKRAYDGDRSTFNYAGNETPVTLGGEITIINRAGFTLPATGGRSAAVLGGVGGVLVLAGAGLLLGVKKKKDE